MSYLVICVTLSYLLIVINDQCGLYLFINDLCYFHFVVCFPCWTLGGAAAPLPVRRCPGISSSVSSWWPLSWRWPSAKQPACASFSSCSRSEYVLVFTPSSPWPRRASVVALAVIHTQRIAWNSFCRFPSLLRSFVEVLTSFCYYTAIKEHRWRIFWNLPTAVIILFSPTIIIVCVSFFVFHLTFWVHYLACWCLLHWRIF